MGDKEKNRVDNCGRLFSSAHENAVITASYGSATERVKLKSTKCGGQVYGCADGRYTAIGPVAQLVERTPD